LVFQEAKIVSTLPGHSDRVNCTEWLPRHAIQLPIKPAKGSLPLLLASGDASGTIIIWAQQDPLSKLAATTPPKTLRENFVLAIRIPAAHSRAVTCLVSHVLANPRSNPNPKALLVSTSSDGTVKIWGVGEGGSGQGLVEVNCVQTILVGPKAMMSAAVIELSQGGEGLLLALGGLDNAVHLYVGSGDLQV
jgi:elongator complex protein 2